MNAPQLYVVMSHIQIDPGGADTLDRAFRERLGEVERAPGFVRLEVWRSERDPGRYAMTTWWERKEDFRRYMASDAHSRSHARIPSSPARPRGAGIDRYTLVAR